MLKKLLSVAFTILFIISTTLYEVNSVSNYDLSVLKNCRAVFSYSEKNCAYFYGFSEDTLYSSKVSPSVTTRYVSVNGLICSVCHDENNAYALFERSGNNFSVVEMNMQNGDCRYYDVGRQRYILSTSFAVSDDEIFIICNDSAYAYVAGYNKNGVRKFKYAFGENNVETLFINASASYAKLSDGDIYSIGNGRQKFCTNIDYCDKFCNAGAGYIFTEDNRLVTLGDNTSRYTYEVGFYQIVKSGVRTFYINGSDVCASDGGVYSCSGAKMIAASSEELAVLNSENECYVADISERNDNKIKPDDDGKIGKSDNVKSLGNTYWIKDGILYGVESGTTAAQMKSKISDSISIFNRDGDEVKSGKIKTGYELIFSDKSYPISVRGDVTGEGNVNTTDIRTIMKHFVGLEEMNGIFFASADFNFDDSVDNRDLVLIAQKYENEKQ